MRNAGQKLMAAQRYSLFLIIFICSCVHSATISNLSVKNQAQGCFTLLKKDVQRGEPVVLNFDVGVGDATQDCPCKSALFKYAVSQENGKDVSSPITGNFTIINKKSVTLLLSVQSQHIIKVAN